MAHVLPLGSVGLADADRVGRKAAVLGELIRRGFPVPDGFAVTVSAMAEPQALAEALRTALNRLGNPLVAVRSSGVAEDLEGMSYAGQYESILNVSGVAEVLAAIRICWASASSDRVAAYRGADNGQSTMGVLVQRMVPAVAAGVAFSSNPLTGDRSETLVSAVVGLGDRLMAGEVTADEWTVRGDEVRQSSGTASAIDSATARSIARLAREVAAYFEVPQDIEWAIADGKVWLLQARPITALPDPVVPIEIEVPPGFSTRNRAIDRPWTPLERSLFLPAFSTASRHVFAYTTGMAPEAHTIGGWVYLTMQPDTVEDSVARLERIAASVAEGEPRALVERWNSFWKPHYASEIARLRGVDLPSLSDVDLAAHTRSLAALFGDLHDTYFRLTGAAIALLGDLGVFCAEELGWSAAETLRLRPGLTGDHMGATTGLATLAPLLDGPEFDDAYAEYVHSFGHRTIGFDLNEPTLAEQPAVLLSLIRAQRAQAYDFPAEKAALDARLAAALAEARAALADKPAATRDRFEAAFEGSCLGAPVRDEKVFYAVSLWALVRYAALELGRRLTARGSVSRPEDALFLELDEGLAALAGGADRRALVTLHRGQHAWALANPGPPAYGQPPVPPVPGPHVQLSAGAQRVMRVAQWSMALMGGRRPDTVEDGQLAGVAASPGRYTGPVRVIRTVAEFDKLRPGDVLVCPETTAQWAILFPSVGALITDRGSLLSHPAIIAREYGVPAVVATGNATSALQDDQLVTVDGSAGTVKLTALDCVGS